VNKENYTAATRIVHIILCFWYHDGYADTRVQVRLLKWEVVSIFCNTNCE